MALINVVKKIEKARTNLGMEVSESVVAACTTNPKGAMKRSLAVGLGGVVGAAIAGRNGATAETADAAPTPGMADRFVAGQHALVLTDQRLFLASLSALTGKPKEVVATWARADVAQISVEETKLAYPMTITFADGSAVAIEGAKGTDPKSLAL